MPEMPERIWVDSGEEHDANTNKIIARRTQLSDDDDTEYILASKYEEMIEELKDPTYCTTCGNCGDDGCCGIHKCQYPQDTPKTIALVESLEAEITFLRNECRRQGVRFADPYTKEPSHDA